MHFCVSNSDPCLKNKRIDKSYRTTKDQLRGEQTASSIVIVVSSQLKSPEGERDENYEKQRTSFILTKTFHLSPTVILKFLRRVIYTPPSQRSLFG